MYEKTGVASQEMVAKILPARERRDRGPYVQFECFQPIPCNPCCTVCRSGAVEIHKDINRIPHVDYEKCTGCGICVSVCPGLACFIIDETYSEQEAAVKIPYEYLPLPEEGQEAEALDRDGKPIGKAKVIKVQNNKNLDKTNIITFTVPKEQLLTVRNIRVGGSR